MEGEKKGEEATNRNRKKTERRSNMVLLTIVLTSGEEKTHTFDDAQMNNRNSSCSESKLFFHWPKKMQESLNP